MNRDEQILLTEEFVKQNLKSYDSGHDWWHIVRVRKLAKFINENEMLVDPFMVDITALLHDTADSKFAGGNKDQCYQLIGNLLAKCGLLEMSKQILNVIKNVSFSNTTKNENADDPLLRIIQDADRLDALGAIGIARAFNYGGFRNNPIFIPGDKTDTKSKSTIGHFYDKLLKLKGMMNTATGRRLAEERHNFLEVFLMEFYKELEFRDVVK
jgi:uncharacterized protein